MTKRSGIATAAVRQHIVMNRTTLLLAVVIAVSSYAGPKDGGGDASEQQARPSTPALSEVKDEVKGVARKKLTKAEDWLETRWHRLRERSGTESSPEAKP